MPSGCDPTLLVQGAWARSLVGSHAVRRTQGRKTSGESNVLVCQARERIRFHCLQTRLAWAYCGAFRYVLIVEAFWKEKLLLDSLTKPIPSE